jgi:hypothetical protein
MSLFKHLRRMLNWRWPACGALLLIVSAFPFGPLFPWSPVHPGYREQRFERATVLYPSGIELPEAYRHMDAYISRAEQFHRLRMPSRLVVVMCRNWNDFERFMPHLRSRQVAGVALFTGTVIYITPKVQEKRVDTNEYLRHELSHACLHQNQSWLNSIRMSGQPWFVEGLAVLFGEQKSYVTPEEFLERSMRQELGPVIDPEQRESAPKPFDMRMGYQAWRYFLEYLIETRGRQLFQHYLAADIASPTESLALFARTFGVPLGREIQRFQDDIRADRWKPKADFVSAHLN